MSVSDPLIKEIKGCTLQLHQSNATVDDSSPALLKFCQIFEQICTKGFKLERLCFYGRKNQAPLEWFFKIPNIDHYDYETSVDLVKKCRRVKTTVGKFRLLVRHCLVKKCLNYPVEILSESRSSSIYYYTNSILGDEILSAILRSVLLQINRINFSLDLENSSFLDETWLMPDLIHLELVPCRALGVTVGFTNDKAVIVAIESNSVASETEEICVGDILHSMNGQAIYKGLKGSLGGVLQKNKGPATVTILKSYHSQTNGLYPPINKLLKELEIKDQAKCNKKRSNETENLMHSKGGFPAYFLTAVDAGDRGSTREIDETIRKFVHETSKPLENKIQVRMEINELTVRVHHNESDETLFEHNFMDISSCGSVPFIANYLAYMVGSRDKGSTRDRFDCYIFYVNKVELVDKILKSIGNGFHRTHFAV